MELYDKNKKYIFKALFSGTLFNTELDTEAALLGCSYEKAFWKYAANLQENTHVDVRLYTPA